MDQQSFTTEIAVSRPPEAVTEAVADVRGWWTGAIDGDATAVGDRFTYRALDVHRSEQVVTALDPGRRVVWHVTDSDLAFATKRDEWTGTDLVFDVRPDGTGARLVFTHVGLTPDRECVEQCAPAWTHYIGTSLKARIERGG